MDFPKEKLINAAQAKGICDGGMQRLLASPDVNDMINYYVENPDWCLERDFPSLQTLRDHIPDLTKKGVYVDHAFHGEVLNDLQTYIFHNCKGTIKVGLNVDKAIIPMLYVANGCRLRIVGTGEVAPKKPSEVPIYIFGKNDLSARNNKFVTYKIYENGLIKRNV